MPPIVPPPKPSFDWRSASRKLSFWILLLLVPVAYIQFSAARGEPTREISYTEYSRQLDNKNITAVVIEGGHTVRGQLKDPIVIDGHRVTSFTMKYPVANSEAEIDRLRNGGVASIEGRDERLSVLAIIVNVLPWILLIAVWFFLMRQMQAGGAKAFSFGKSKAKLLTGDTPKVTFADVAGADEAKIELQEIIEFLKDPQKFTKLGGRLPKGALLVGPPGTGKTLLAKAVAGEAGRPFFSMSGSDFVEMFVGVGALSLVMSLLPDSSRAIQNAFGYNIALPPTKSNERNVCS